MKNLFTLFTTTLIVLNAYSQFGYLDCSSTQVKNMASEYDIQSIRTDDGTKCLFYFDKVTELHFAMFFDDYDYCKLVIVTPDDWVSEKAVFKLLDDNWHSISSTEWYGISKGKRVNVKALRDGDKLNGLFSFYYSR